MSIRRDNGFTLIELSIVLVIIGLIVGGILVGRELIRSATVRAQVKQFIEYEVAMNTFKNKYNCMPGDCANASIFWSTALNGDGDSIIDMGPNAPESSLLPNPDPLDTNGYYDLGGYEGWTDSPEVSSYFIHLGLSELVPTAFDGTPVIGRGLPSMPIAPGSATFFAGSRYNFEATREPNVANFVIDARYNNAFWFIGCKVEDGNMFMWDDACGIFRPIDMQNIDIKLDDGKPLTGRMIGFSGSEEGSGIEHCVVDNERYDVSYEDPQCQGAYMFN